MAEKLDFRPIKNMIESPSEVIDVLIKHLELIKSDLNEPYHDLEVIKASINMRSISVQCLNDLLEEYLNQQQLTIRNHPGHSSEEDELLQKEFDEGSENAENISTTK